MTVDQILELARGLPPGEQRRLLDELRALSGGGSDAPPTQGGYGTLLDLAGTAHSEYGDVSQNKLEHLGEAYAAQ